MTEVASSELRNETRSILERVEAGEPVTITVDGRPVAELIPVSRDRWMRRDEFVRLWRGAQADRALAVDLAELAGRIDRRPPIPVTRGLADTSVFAARESGRPLDHDALPDELAVSVVTLSEMRVCACRSTTRGSRRPRCPWRSRW